MSGGSALLSSSMHRSSRQLCTSAVRLCRKLDNVVPCNTRELSLLTFGSRSRSQWIHPKHFGISFIDHLNVNLPLGCRGISGSAAGCSTEVPEDDALPKPASTKSVEQIVDELRQLNHIRALVSQLHMALHVPDTYQTEMQSLQDQLNEIQSELRPLEEKKIELLMRAERRSKILAWAGLGFMGMQFGFLARLTWWEYSWDIIEPVTYFVTYGTAMGLYAYYLVTRQDYSFPAVTERWTALAFHKNVRRTKWEMNRYIELRNKLGQLQSEIEKMSLLAPRPLKSPSMLSPDPVPKQ